MKLLFISPNDFRDIFGFIIVYYMVFVFNPAYNKINTIQFKKGLEHNSKYFT